MAHRHRAGRRLAFAKKGANVVVAGRRDEAGHALVKELHSFGSEAEFINADVRNEGDVRAMVDRTVDVLVVWMLRSTTPPPKATAA